MDAQIHHLFENAGCTGALHVRRHSDGAEIEFSADDVWLAASVIKVAIGLEFYAQTADERIDPTRMITLPSDRRTPGPTGISAARDAVTMSLRDLCTAMLSISDNAATDAILDCVGVEAVNRRLDRIGCTSTVLVESIGDMINGLAIDLGYTDYATLLRAQAGDFGADAQQSSTDQDRIEASRVLDPDQGTRTTARDMTRLLDAVWRNEAASDAACADLRAAMATQVTRRLAPAVPEGGQLAAKTGSLFGRVRNEVAVISAPTGEHYAIAVLTRPNRPFAGTVAIDNAMAEAVRIAIAKMNERSWLNTPESERRADAS